MAKLNAATLPEVDAYIANAAPFAQPILLYLREIVHEGVAAVEGRSNFKAMSPSSRREYSEWIAEGKSRNWKHERC